jgi:rhodanese-related sulfurtransferase
MAMENETVMRRGILVATLFLAVLIAACAKPGADETQWEVRSLSPDTLQAWMSEGHPLVLLDTRPDSLYRAERIAGAVPAAGRSIPDLRQVLPTDHVTAVVFYNGDGTAPVSGLDPAREAAEIYRFPLVYRLEGGLGAWIERGYEIDGMRDITAPR